MATLTSRQTRTKRLNLRATDLQEKLIRMAARKQGASVTDFILQSACRQAEQTLVDQREFTVSESRWKAFVEALDRPMQSKPRLERLFSEPSILERKD